MSLFVYFWKAEKEKERDSLIYWNNVQLPAVAKAELGPRPGMGKFNMKEI